MEAAASGEGPMNESAQVVELRAKIKAAGDAVRDKKAAGEDFEPALAVLKDLKTHFEQVSGAPLDSPKKGGKKGRSK